jgi:hypothetical protein
MHIKNLPDLVRVAIRSQVAFEAFYTHTMFAKEAKACVLAAGEHANFYPELVTSVIDLISELDPSTEFIFAQESWVSIYIGRSSVPVEELAKLLNDTGPIGVETGDEVPELHFYGRPLVRAWWEWDSD